MIMNWERYLKLRYIYLLSIINCVIMTYIFKVDISIDTPTYIDAWSTLQEGHLDKMRTPVYPLFLGLMNTICGNNYLYYVVAIQHLVFLVSIRYFYLLMQDIITNNNISIFLTIFYALYPCIATYNCCIATEIFAVAGSVSLLYSILKLYRTEFVRYGLYSFLWLFFLIFLRPAVVYLLPIFIVGWCIVAIKEKKYLNTSVLYGLSGSVLVSISLIVYMAMFKSNYGVFTPSCVGLNNKYAIAKAANVIDFNAIGNEELLTCLVDEDSINAIGKETENLINAVGMESFSEIVNQSIKQNKVKYLKRLLQNAQNASENNLFEPSYQIGIIGTISSMMGVKIKVIYILFLIYFFVLIRWMNRKKEMAFFSCILFMIGVSNYILIIIASPGEYGRLSLPAIPVYLIMIGQLLDLIWIKRISEAKFA